MKKIHSLFKRDFTQPSAPIIDEYEVQLPADAIATRKFDGTAVRIWQDRIWNRFDAKHGKAAPPDFEPCEPEPDPITGHWPGWIPADLHLKANRSLLEAIPADSVSLVDGTYELCGPRVNGNPEHFERHVLMPHGKEILADCPRTFEALRAWLTPRDIEGVVWWYQGEPVAKIKKRDFGLQR